MENKMTEQEKKQYEQEQEDWSKIFEEMTDADLKKQYRDMKNLGYDY